MSGGFTTPLFYGLCYKYLWIIFFISLTTKNFVVNA